jgi:hypothetical protein
MTLVNHNFMLTKWQNAFSRSKRKLAEILSGMFSMYHSRKNFQFNHISSVEKSALDHHTRVHSTATIEQKGNEWFNPDLPRCLI